MPRAKHTQPVNDPVVARRHDTIVPEAGQDPYRLARQFPEPTTCTTCGAWYRRGRWAWAGAGEHTSGAHEVVCPACRRIADGYCAGELLVSGAFVSTHRADIDATIAAEAKLETDEHPLNRIARIEPEGDGFRVVTTDVHLARRLGEALRGTYKGTLEVEYPLEAETVRVAWERKDAHEPTLPEAAPAFPVEVLGKGMELPPEAETMVAERIARLRRFHDEIQECRVTVEAPEGHRRQGGPYSVSIQLQVPGPDIVVNRHQADDLRVALRLAFEAAQRKLEAQARRYRKAAPREDGRSHGQVARLLPDKGYGFLEAEDGHEVYFHENSVLGAKFQSLSVGERVRFVEEPGDNGPQATSVFARAMD